MILVNVGYLESLKSGSIVVYKKGTVVFLCPYFDLKENGEKESQKIIFIEWLGECRSSMM